MYSFSFSYRIASFYETLMPDLEKAIKKLNWETQRYVISVQGICNIHQS